MLALLSVADAGHTQEGVCEELPELQRHSQEIFQGREVGTLYIPGVWLVVMCGGGLVVQV